MKHNKFRFLFVLTCFVGVLFAFFSYSAYFNEIEVKNKVKGIDLNWGEANLSEIESIIVMRKENECPINIFDGKEIYRGFGSGYFDEEVEVGRFYCYGVGVVSLSGSSSKFENSRLVERLGFIDYFVFLIESNYIIIFGPFLIFTLAIFIKINKRKRKERQFQKQIRIKNIEVDIFY